MNDRDIYRLKAEYSTPQALMDVVRQARDYLKDALSGLLYEARPIKVRMNCWGELTQEGIYKVCLGGLWHLLEKGRLTTHRRRDNDRHHTVQFLNEVRFQYVGRDTVFELLGIDTGTYLYPPTYDCDDPQAVLTFLDWLVQQELGKDYQEGDSWWGAP